MYTSELYMCNFRTLVEAGAIFQRGPVLDHQGRTVKRDELAALEFSEGPRHGFPCGPDDLTDFFMLQRDRKSTRLNSSHLVISYAVFCLKKKHYRADSCLDFVLFPCHHSAIHHPFQQVL